MSQASLFNGLLPVDVSSFQPSTELRVIHYLGSKLRLLAPIRNALTGIVRDGGSICDLFAGSGAVSLALHSRWDVTSVDIQEYSRVLCHGVVRGTGAVDRKTAALIESATRSAFYRALSDAAEDLIDYEFGCLSAAETGHPEALCEIIERGALAIRPNAADGSNLMDVLNSAAIGLSRTGLGTGPNTVVTRHFGGVYFSWHQAVEFDALLKEVHELAAEDRDFFLAAVLATASDIVNTVGKQFAQPLRPRDASGRPKIHLIRQTIRDRSKSVIRTFQEWVERFNNIPRHSGAHRAIRADYRDVLRDRALTFDAVYADPPYTRDHYSRYYHVLETMALHDEPAIAKTTVRCADNPMPSRGIYREDRHQSPFCIKSAAPGALDQLCAGVAERNVPLVLSYSPYLTASANRPRVLTIDVIDAIAKRYFTRVECQHLNTLTHNKLNISSRNKRVRYPAEVLFVCRP